MWILWVLAIGFLLLFAYVRLAPSDPARWHVRTEVDRDKTYSNGALRRLATGPGGLKKLNAIITQDARSDVLAGSTDEGMVTYITRTRVVGFPDYVTAWMEGDDLVVHSRSRFGRRDFGVNSERVDRWLADLSGD
ncbi:DUF1499 domain-containing protein [Shimia biformata]|uniref:DUF1499 domain-containing protein n=1 Tax=Shimia biformata TaxID=1294299 RepID=UPI001EF36C0A|nr:DUF1499 domain-containing protein [Shimia biformata]